MLYHDNCFEILSDTVIKHSIAHYISGVKIKSNCAKKMLSKKIYVRFHFVIFKKNYESFSRTRWKFSFFNHLN